MRMEGSCTRHTSEGHIPLPTPDRPHPVGVGTRKRMTIDWEALRPTCRACGVKSSTVRDDGCESCNPRKPKRKVKAAKVKRQKVFGHFVLSPEQAAEVERRYEAMESMNSIGADMHIGPKRIRAHLASIGIDPSKRRLIGPKVASTDKTDR